MKLDTTHEEMVAYNEPLSLALFGGLTMSTRLGFQTSLANEGTVTLI